MNPKSKVTTIKLILSMNLLIKIYYHCYIHNALGNLSGDFSSHLPFMIVELSHVLPKSWQMRWWFWCFMWNWTCSEPCTAADAECSLTPAQGLVIHVFINIKVFPSASRWPWVDITDILPCLPQVTPVWHLTLLDAGWACDSAVSLFPLHRDHWAHLSTHCLEMPTQLLSWPWECTSQSPQFRECNWQGL